MIRLTAVTITWVKVPKPTLNLAGVIVGSLAIAGTLAVLTIALGLAFAFLLIRHHRRRALSITRLADLDPHTPPSPV